MSQDDERERLIKRGLAEGKIIGATIDAARAMDVEYLRRWLDEAPCLLPRPRKDPDLSASGQPWRRDPSERALDDAARNALISVIDACEARLAWMDRHRNDASAETAARRTTITAWAHDLRAKASGGEARPHAMFRLVQLLEQLGGSSDPAYLIALQFRFEHGELARVLDGPEGRALIAAAAEAWAGTDRDGRSLAKWEPTRALLEAVFPGAVPSDLPAFYRKKKSPRRPRRLPRF